jgi:methionyl-tRNA formyltransferase
MQEKSPPKKIAIIAKHEIYCEDVLVKFKDSECIIETYVGLNQGYQKVLNGEYSYVFFPHYSSIIPDEILQRYDCVGFHTGNLPNDRGGSPIQNKILKGEYQTKISAFKMTKEIDLGPIYCQRKVDLEFGNIKDIIFQISKLISEMIFEITYSRINPIEQKGSGLVYKRLTEINSKMNLDELSIKNVYDRIRMVDGYEYPRAHIETVRYKIDFSNAKLDGEKIIANVEIQEKLNE